jgi:hypothetical protein
MVKASSLLSESISDSSQLDGTVISGSGATFGEWMIKRLVDLLGSIYIMYTVGLTHAVKHRSKYVPLRLNAEERTKLRLYVVC